MKNKKHKKINKKLLLQTSAGICLLAASAGIVFGVSAATFNISYVKVDRNTRLTASVTGDYGTQIEKESGWNLSQILDPGKRELEENNDAHIPYKIIDESGKSEQEKRQERYNYITQIIDGAEHAALDRSFNESVYTGLVRYINQDDSITNVDPPNQPGSKNSARTALPSKNDSQSFHKVYEQASTEAHVLALAGFNHATPLSSIAEKDLDDKGRAIINSSLLRKATFVLIDGNVPNNQNVASVMFRTDQSAFLTGIATCMYFVQNLQDYHDKGQDLSVGIYGGAPIPTVTIFIGDFQRGVEFFNNHILKNVINSSKYADSFKKLSIHKTEQTIEKLMEEYSVKTISLGTFSSHFTGSFATGDATGLTRQLINRKASAILSVAGPQILDTTQEILAQGSKCIGIGVDIATEAGDFQRPSKYVDKSTDLEGNTSAQRNNVIKFSAVKNMASVTTKITDIHSKGFNYTSSDTLGTFNPKESICGPGYKTVANMLNSGIGISFGGWAFAIEALSFLDNDVSGKSFTDIWTKVLKDNVDPTAGLIRTLDEMATFKHDPDSKSVYSNFDLYTSVLGKALNTYSIDFPNYEDVKPSQKSILQWIEDNMYFMV